MVQQLRLRAAARKIFPGCSVFFTGSDDETISIRIVNPQGENVLRESTVTVASIAVMNDDELQRLVHRLWKEQEPRPAP